MIEAIMLFIVGFLVASLLGLVAATLVHNRAVRLTKKRLEAMTPVSLVEIQADKDQLRAEFAMATRRLELTIDQLRAKDTGQMAEIGKKSDAINRLKAELDGRNAAISALEMDKTSLEDQLTALQFEHQTKLTLLRTAEEGLQDKHKELVEAGVQLDERAATLASQRIEVAALQTQVMSLKQAISGYEHEVAALNDRLIEEADKTAEKMDELSHERTASDALKAQIAELESQLVARSIEIDILERRVAEAENLSAAQEKALSERVTEMADFVERLQTAQKTEIALRTDLAALSERSRTDSERFATERASLESLLARTQDEGRKLLADITALKQEAELTWKRERSESAALRETMSSIAAQIASLTASVEGPQSPIEAILFRDEEASHTNGAKHKGQQSLADRIRALHGKNSQVEWI